MSRNISLEVTEDTSLLGPLIEDSFYLRTPDYDPRQFQLSDMADGSINIFSCQPSAFSSNFLMDIMEVYCAAASKDSTGITINYPVYRCSLRQLLEEKRGVLISENRLKFIVPCSPTGYYELTVTILNQPIRNGRRRLFATSTVGRGDISRFLDETVMMPQPVPATDDAYGLDQLDSSDIHSLDMTTRGKMTALTLEEGDRLEADRIPRPLSAVMEVTEEGLDSTTPFSPVSDQCQFSTMRETSLNKLSEMLANVEAGELELGDQEPGQPVLTPANGSHSVEEMQRSLSRENSPNKEGVVDIPAGDRSINFATKTTIYQELNTPQVKVDNKRFEVREGNTKLKDGIAGKARKSLKPSLQNKPKTKPSREESIWNEGSTSRDFVPISNGQAKKNGQKSREESIWNEENETPDVVSLSNGLQSHQNGRRSKEDSIWDNDEEIQPLANNGGQDGGEFSDEEYQAPHWDETFGEGMKFCEIVRDETDLGSVSLNGSVWGLEPEPIAFNLLNSDLKIDQTWESKKRK